MNYSCSNWWDMRNLQEQVKKTFCYQKLCLPFIAWINCSTDLKNFACFSRSVEQFFLTVGQNNFGNKIPLLLFSACRRSGKKSKQICSYRASSMFKILHVQMDKLPRLGDFSKILRPSQNIWTLKNWFYIKNNILILK